MIATKPMMIAPEVKTPDYTGFIRKSMSNIDFGNSSFADTMAAEQSAARQSSVRQNPSSMFPTLDERKATEEGTAPAPGGELLSRGAMALDQRSLATLQKLATSAKGALSSGGKTADAPAASARGQASNRADQSALPVAAAQSRPARPLGMLSARYESGSQGIAAIGYDRNGGTSYGKYQISSRQGSFESFLAYAEKKAPDIAERLRGAGKANTGSKRGAVPDAWKAIAAEQPERFEKLQEDFIRQSHYDPVESEVKKTLGAENLSRPIQEVLWSTAVQHGPTGAQRLFERAAQRLANQGKKPSDEKALIEIVYSLRGSQFGSSAPAVQIAVRQRFDNEKRQALAMLREHQQTVVA